MVEKDKIKAVFILEILGKPKDYVKETLKQIIEEIGRQKDVKMINNIIAEPKQIEKQDAFTTFAEVEIETTLNQMMMLIFKFTPSHIEIIEPENIEISNYNLNSLFNDLVARIHQYDEIARALMIEREIIAKQIQAGQVKISENLPQKTDSKLVKNKKKKKI